MNKLIGFLVIFLVTSTANAQQITFTGHFLSGSGGIQVNDAFSGQFTFNLESPDSSEFYPGNALSSGSKKIFIIKIMLRQLRISVGTKLM